MTGHQINSLVGDLVAMAQAMERLPQVEAERDAANANWIKASKTVQERELSIIGLKSEIELLHTKLREAEVAKDSAETMFLEADDRLLNVERSFQIALEAMDATDKLIQSFKPVPMPVIEDKPMWHGDLPKDESASPLGGEHVPSQEQSASVHPVSAPNFAEGQSEPDPIPATTQMDEAKEASVETTVTSSDTAAGSDGPYTNRRYIDVPHYVSLHEWLIGGGTEEGYYAGRNTSTF